MKNIVSNIIGVLLIGIAVYGLVWYELDTIKFTLLIAIGLACFYFENKTIKELLKSFFEKKIK
jgi:uncharacterized membrane protein YbaN (DUF454 family)